MGCIIGPNKDVSVSIYGTLYPSPQDGPSATNIRDIKRGGIVDRLCCCVLYLWESITAKWSKEYPGLSEKLRETITHINAEIKEKKLKFKDIAFVVIDIQNDFVDGTLGGKTPEEVRVREEAIKLARITALYLRFRGSLILGTRDYHPEDHIGSFSRHRHDLEVNPCEPLEMPRTEKNEHLDSDDIQMVWPTHCVWGTPGAWIHKLFPTWIFHHIEEKGMERNADAYSALRDVYGNKASRLEDILKEFDVKKVLTGGLCKDVCVEETAVDAAVRGFDVSVLRHAAVGISPTADQDVNANFVTLKEDGTRRRPAGMKGDRISVPFGRDGCVEEEAINIGIIPSLPSFGG